MPHQISGMFILYAKDLFKLQLSKQLECHYVKRYLHGEYTLFDVGLIEVDMRILSQRMEMKVEKNDRKDGNKMKNDKKK